MLEEIVTYDELADTLNEYDDDWSILVDRGTATTAEMKEWLRNAPLTSIFSFGRRKVEARYEYFVRMSSKSKDVAFVGELNSDCVNVNKILNNDSFIRFI